MSTKLLICPFFGDLPAFFPQWRESVRGLERYGYDVLVDQDLDAFNARCEKVLGFKSPIVPGTGKLWDFRCALGELYADEVADYDFWGHTDFDVVYGNPETFMPDEVLAGVDIVSDEKSYIGGHWTLYRNCAPVNSVFRKCHNWRGYMTDPRPSGWVETDYTAGVKQSGLRLKFIFGQASRDNEWLSFVDGRLYQRGKEVLLAHFRDQKRWPL